MKNILLLVHDDAGQEARLQAALDITRALQGHLNCVDVALMPMLAGDYDATGATMLLADEREREAQNRTRLEERLAREAIQWDWINAVGDMAECITRASGLADLIVVNRKLDAFATPDMRGITGTIAIRSRKPLVAVPDDSRAFDTAGTALIAWDGSAPVMRTMQACVPLLKLAASVRLFTVDDGSEAVPAEEAATYLSRHDIHASIERVDGLDRKADTLIAEACEASGAAYCLMGAYSHGRLAETLFGGVTRRLLESCRLPLVLGR
ncbi:MULTISPECIES: universal stress protein [Sphingomonadaceae]|uniref:UspA domain-containing protein n=1 Tax=Sphingomonas sanxanigenens DSM 19645 = NX02 TaxID=1123269 RepID=W0AAT7_9SPHN|nr:MULTISPECIES: universal stress protein [Sphingomonadaceae]AHE53587.1 hypothetical protein NX02_09330 [Sphingomonas sanxanigenens DSM 19645 = NX02]OAN53381.1 universal stress protein UspA [Sphingobium sp. TCM1]